MAMTLLARRGRTLGPLVATAIVAALVAALLAGVAAPLHDRVGTFVPGPRVPAVVLEADGPLGPAAQAARAAGARSVVAALPPGHPLLDGVEPEPPGLAADRGGRVRWYRDTRLPLPEALHDLVRLSVSQLDPGDPRQLAGQDVVLEPADPAIGLSALAPGTSGPVDRSELLAVGLGTVAIGQGLWAVTLPWTVFASALAAFGAARALARTPPANSLVVAAGATVAWGGIVVAARAWRIDLPLEAVVPVIVVPLVARLAGTTRRALRALDQVALRLGAPTTHDTVHSGLDARAAMARLYAPAFTVAAWTAGPAGGPPVRTVLHGDETQLPVLDALPGATLARHGWRIEPVRAEGAVVGAIGIGGPDTLPPDVAAMVEAVARAGLGVPDRAPATPSDALDARIQLVSRGVDQALHESETWRSLLGSSGLSIGLFELGGDLVAAGARLRARLDPRSTSPLVDLLVAVTGFDADLVATVLRRAVAETGPPRRIPSRDGSEEVVISRLEADWRVGGLLVQIHDIGPHLRLDRLKSNVVVASGARLRGILSHVVRDAESARHADAERRTAYLDSLRARIARAEEELERAAALAVTRVGENPIQPVFLQDALQEAKTALDPSWQGQVDVTLPAVSFPVAARSVPLVRALGGLLQMLAGHGGRVRVDVWAGDEGMHLAFEDDSGGLPAGMLERMVDPDSASEAGGAVREIKAMGGTFTRESEPGEGTRLVFGFPYF